MTEKYGSEHNWLSQNNRREADIHLLKAPWLVECSARTVVPLAINVWIKDMISTAVR